MRTRSRNFVPENFSFHDDPILILDEFWTLEETVYFRETMDRVCWKALTELPDASRTFRNCGNWLQVELGGPQRSAFLASVTLYKEHNPTELTMI
ncbi:MAG: hypothetical protein ACE5K1_08770 [Acidiferrobacterales bacterium]